MNLRLLPQCTAYVRRNGSSRKLGIRDTDLIDGNVEQAETQSDESGRKSNRCWGDRPFDASPDSIQLLAGTKVGAYMTLPAVSTCPVRVQ